MAGRTGRVTRAAPDAVGAAPGRRGRRAQTLLFLAALAGVAAATALGSVAADRHEQDRTEERAAATTAAAAASTRTVVGRAIDLLAGASAVLDDRGEVSVPAFERFAEDVARGGGTSSLALITRVAANERAAFERLTGITISSLDAAGGLVPAPAADEYLPVVAAEPGDDFRLGVDYLSDPVRGPAVAVAREARTGAVTAPTTLPGTGEDGILVIHPLVSPSGDIAGYVAAPLRLDDLLAELAAALPAETEFAIVEGGAPFAVVGEPDGPTAMTAEVALPGRTWQLTVEPSEGAERTIVLVVVLTGIGVWLALFALFIVTIRNQRRLDRANRSISAAEQRSRSLERLASQLSRSLSGSEVAGALLESLHGLTGATGGAVAIVSADGDQLDLVAGHGYPEADRAGLARVPLEAGSALTTAVATGEAAWFPSPLTWRHDPALSRYASIGNAAAVIPLAAESSVRGVLVVSQPSVRRFSDDERSLLVTIGALAGRALDRSLRYDAEHATAVAFQRASLPASLPATPGSQVAARYRPATRSASVGGDWYDVLQLHDGRLAVIVGDVVGHGVTAAAAMGHLRSAVRVLASVLPEPVALLRSLTADIASIPDALSATMAYGVLDPVAGTFDFIRAGHLPPLLLRASGTAEFPPGDPWPPLGVTPRDEPVAHTVALCPGDTVLLYTDGVAERRGESLTVGLERLRAAGAALGDLDPDDLCDALLEAIVPSDDQADDVALLAVRYAPAEVASDGVDPRPAKVAAES